MSEHEPSQQHGHGQDTRSAPWLKLEVRPDGDRMLLAVHGEVDIDTEQALYRALRDALGRSVTGVNLDLCGVAFCDCAGLNVLLRARQDALAQGKTLAVRAAAPAVERLLALTGTLSLFDFPGDLADEDPEDDERRPSSAEWQHHAKRPNHVEHANGMERTNGMNGMNGMNGTAGTDRAPGDEHANGTGHVNGTPHVNGADRGQGSAESELRIELGQLRRAMQTRPVIDLARGVLMASFALTPEHAWSVLVTVSQRTNTKLHQVAEELVGTVRGASLPEPFQRQLAAAVTPFVTSPPATGNDTLIENVAESAIEDPSVEPGRGGSQHPS